MEGKEPELNFFLIVKTQNIAFACEEGNFHQNIEFTTAELGEINLCPFIHQTYGVSFESN